jgi:hypothetical protein
MLNCAHIVVRMSVCRIVFCCTAIGVLTASSQDRYVCRKACVLTCPFPFCLADGLRKFEVESVDLLGADVAGKQRNVPRSEAGPGTRPELAPKPAYLFKIKNPLQL